MTDLLIDSGMTGFKSEGLLQEINRHARHKILKKEEAFIRSGDPILFIPFVIKGSLRVIREDNKGQEVFLYHLYPGQTCAMSLACCQSGSRSMVKVLAELDTEIIQIPVSLIDHLFSFPEWRIFITSNYFNRFSELLEVIDLISFNQMDKQLSNYLVQRARANGTKILKITHQEVADELHTHREAISRLLQVMEQKGFVKLGRNKIQLLKEY